MKVKVSNVNTPNWKEVTVKSRVPVELEKLSEIARNIWWAWNYEATELFSDLDPALWKEVGQNPVLLLERMSYEKLEALSKDKVILRRMNDVYSKFRDYMDVKPDTTRPSVAYFSMEYGLTHVLKIYSGGLGVLAGDYLKEASDSNVDLCAVGFLYRYGYFTQSLSMDGQQIANYEAQNFGQLPIDRVLDADGKPMVVAVPYMNYFVHANVWRVNVGRISLYLLDTDNELNSEFDRPITHQLYGGDWENRLKQEILLGIGGILTLKALGIKKDVYHCNEGHAALINVQRICDYVATGLTFDQSIELVRASSLYTVHTPVPAGHDYFDEGLFGKYMGGYPAMMGISWDDLMDLGRNNPGDKGERLLPEKYCKQILTFDQAIELVRASSLYTVHTPVPAGHDYFDEGLFGSYIVADTLNIDQCSVSFVTMINVFFDAQCFQCQDTTDTQQDFLFQTVFPVATIKLVSNRTVEFAVHFIIRIQQIQRNTSYVYAPYVSMHIIVQIRNIHYQRLTIRIHHSVDRKLTEVLCFIVSNLLTIHRQRLSKVAVTVQETYCTKIYIAVRSFFQVVASQYTQTTGIYFQDATQTIFHAEIGYRRTILIRLHIQIISEFCINIIHSSQNYLVFCQSFQLLIAHTFQQQHRILSTFFPKFRI